MKIFSYFVLIYLFLLISCGDSKPNKLIKKTNHQFVKTSKVSNNSKVYNKQTFKTLGDFRILRDKFSNKNQIEDDSIINNQVPKAVQDLSDTNIEISGYAFPLSLESGKCKAFVLMRILPSCCFGDNLKINEIIYIDSAKDIKEIKSEDFINVKGKLSVGMTEVSSWSDKFLYTIVADEVEIEELSN